MLASVEELKRHLHTAGTVSAGAATAANEALLLELLEAASARLAEERPERTLELDPPLVNTGAAEAPVWEDSAEPVTRKFRVHDVIQVPDLREVTEVRVDDGDPLEAVDYELVERKPGTPALWLHLRAGASYGKRRVHVTGRWGPADSRDLAPSASVRHAALVWAARAFQARSARYSDTMSTPDGGVASYFRQMPPDVQATVNALWVPGA